MSFLPIQDDEVQTAAPVESLLPDPDPGPQPRVPRNIEEVAAQLAWAIDGDPADFGPRVAKNVSAIQAGGMEPLLAQVLDQEASATVAAARAQAEAYARTQDVERTAIAAQMASQAEQARLATTPATHPVQAQVATAGRALERLIGLDYGRDMEALSRNLEQAAGDVATRNIIAQAVSKIGEPSLWDHAQMFFGSFIPFGYGTVANRIVSRITGDEFSFDEHKTITTLRNTFLGLTPPEKSALIEKLMKEDFGLFGDNPAAKLDFFRKVMELTKDEARAEAALNAMGALDVAALTKGLYAMARRGVPLKAVTDTAGEKAAGEMAAKDLMGRTKLSGLNDDELVGRVIAAGVNPFEADPAATAGLNAAAQQKLKDDWNGMLTSIRERLNASGMSADEVAEAASRIRASYMPETNKSVFNVTFGEASADGLKMEVLWQGPEGRAFLSKAAAEKWAIEQGFDNFEVVPKNMGLRSMTADEAAMVADELDVINDELVPFIKGVVRDVEKKLKDLDVNYTDYDGSSPHVRFELQELKKYANDLLTHAKTIKSFNDAIDWQDHYAEFLKVAGPQRVEFTAPVRDVAPDIDFELDDKWMLSTKGRPVADIESDLVRAFVPTDDAAREFIKDYARILSKDGATAVAGGRVLKILAKHGRDDHKLIADVLLARGKSIDWNSVPVSLRNMADNGQYNPVRDDVGININSELHTNPKTKVVEKKGTSGEVLLHELIHAHNTQVITLALLKPERAAKVLTKEQIKAANELRELQLKLRQMLGKNPDWEKVLEYPEELLAYGLTNQNVRDQLSKIKLEDLGYPKGSRSVLDFLWDLFKQVLGFKGNDSALAKLVKEFDNLTGSITEKERSVVSRFIASNPKDAIRVGLPQMFQTKYARRAKPSKEEWLVRQSRVDPLSYDALGKFSDKDIESMPWIAIDPKHGASEQAVEGRVVGVHAEAKVKKELTEFITPYYKGLGRDGAKRVQALLEEGDSVSNAGGVGREFTYAEARGKGLNEKEALAYLATRQLRMVMYHIRNGEMVRHLRAMGLKEVELAGGVKTAGKLLEKDQAPIGTWLYDSVDGTTRQYTDLGMADLYAAGKRVVQLAHPIKMDGELRQTFIIDHTTKVRDIQTALHYRPGEYSRIYTDEYFVTMKKAVKVDGEVKELTETIRTAASPREAEEFVTAMRSAVGLMKGVPRNVDIELERLIGRYFSLDEFKAAHEAGEFDGLRALDFHYTRNKEEYLNGSVGEALASGRLFTSKRSERLYSVDRQRQNTLGVFESLEAEITNVSRVANISQWRETMVRRWMNTFGHLIPARTGNDVADFYKAVNATFTKGDQESVFAERTHKYIMRQIGLRTGEERYYEQMTRRMTERFFTGNEKVESVGAKIRQMGVLGFIRNINFNLTLGMFNPAQLIVQANGAATALILSPLHGAAAAKTFPLLRMALMSDNPDVWRFFSKVEKGLFGNEEEFMKLVRAVRQTGIIDNLRSTALWNMEDGKLNIFGAYPSKVMGSHAFFFNRGEEFSRLVSFDVARREWMAAHKGADWASKDALAQIVVRMDDLTQNMTRANLARFQEGAASIPLQFAQYNIKLAANIMSSLLGKGEGRGFTKPEALQLLAGHILLYGAAGNGLMLLVDELMPEDVKARLSVEQKTYIAQGLLGGLVAQVGEWFTGERTAVAVGSRLGSFDYYQKLADALFTDPKNIYEALMGPTLNTARRIGVIGEVAYLWHRDPELTGKDVMLGLARITTEQVSTLRNAAKAYLYHQHADKMLDKSGVGIAQLTPTEVLAQALGFQPTAAVDVHNLIRSKKDHNQAIEDIASLITKVQKDIITARMRGDHTYADEQHKLLQVLWPTNAGDLLEVQRRIRERVYPYDTEFQKLLGEYLWKGQTYDQPLVTTQQPKKQ